MCTVPPRDPAHGHGGHRPGLKPQHGDTGIRACGTGTTSPAPLRGVRGAPRQRATTRTRGERGHGAAGGCHTQGRWVPGSRRGPAGAPPKCAPAARASPPLSWRSALSAGAEQPRDPPGRRHGLRGRTARPSPAAPRQRRLRQVTGARSRYRRRGRGGSRRGDQDPVLAPQRPLPPPSASRPAPGLGQGHRAGYRGPRRRAAAPGKRSWRGGPGVGSRARDPCQGPGGREPSGWAGGLLAAGRAMPGVGIPGGHLRGESPQMNRDLRRERRWPGRGLAGTSGVGQRRGFGGCGAPGWALWSWAGRCRGSGGHAAGDAAWSSPAQVCGGAAGPKVHSTQLASGCSCWHPGVWRERCLRQRIAAVGAPATPVPQMGQRAPGDWIQSGLPVP